MKILFSPIGTTDPVRNCRDGACLHILRHYHPDKVVLYFTAEMEQRERNTHMCIPVALTTSSRDAL